MAFLCVNTPHIDVYVKKEYLYDGQKGHGELVEGIWVSAKSIQGRALYFETYIPEYGALYDKLPISAFVWKKDIKEDIINIVIQINGKKRSLISTKPDISEENLMELIDKDEKLFKHINGKEIKRKIFIKNKLLNIII